MIFRMRRIAILIPIWDDWACAHQLLARIDATFGALPDWSADIILVDDGSRCLADAGLLPQKNIGLSVLRLDHHCGHQKALLAGLRHALEEFPGRYEDFLLMDGDGEDRPESIPLLLGESRAFPGAVIAAARAERQNGPFFLFFYGLYRLLLRLAGRDLRFGNFVLLPASFARTLAREPSASKHIAATIRRLDPHLREISVPRGLRIEGRSRMGFARLVAHGLNALYVLRI
jgi:glycosyltransferase involved in cell wall biosynthesis